MYIAGDRLLETSFARAKANGMGKPLLLTTAFVLVLCRNVTSESAATGPCDSYTSLNESWRNVNSQAGPLHCDDLLLPGIWYRLIPPAGNAIPETIPPTYSCGAAAPMWLNGTHPQSVSINPVSRQLCVNWDGNPCRWSVPVKVALCSGGYYVYMATSIAAPGCNMVWCAVGTNATLSPREACKQQGNFYCALSQLCVGSYHRCNGYSYCSSGEDEAGCNSLSTSTTTESSLCGGTLYGSGYLRSPNYPSNYSNDLSCNWKLIASSSSGTIELQFYAFSTESCCDYLSIYSSNGTLVNRYSGTRTQSTIVLDNSADVRFTTDSSITSLGFVIWFTSTVSSATTPSRRDICERQGSFYCNSSDFCVPMSYRCTGYAFCYYGEDEVGCNTSAVTPSPTGPIRSSASQQQLGKFCTSDLPRGIWIIVSGYATALLLRLYLSSDQ